MLNYSNILAITLLLFINNNNVGTANVLLVPLKRKTASPQGHPTVLLSKVNFINGFMTKMNKPLQLIKPHLSLWNFKATKKNYGHIIKMDDGHV